MSDETELIKAGELYELINKLKEMSRRNKKRLQELKENKDKDE